MSRIGLNALFHAPDLFREVAGVEGGTPRWGISVRWSSNGRLNERRMVSTKPAAGRLERTEVLAYFTSSISFP